jgi:hypothetical protein
MAQGVHPWAPQAATGLVAARPVTFPGGPDNQPQTFKCDADRVIPAGGALASHLLSDDFKPFSRLYRQAASRGLYSANRSRPFSMVLGAITVPRGQILMLAGAIVRPYGFDPIAAGDAIPLEPRRLALSLGYDLTVAVTGRPGNITAELIPKNPDPTETLAYPVTPSSSVGFPPLPSGPPDGIVATGASGATGALVSAQQAVSPLTAQASPVDPRQYILSASGAPQPITPSTKQGPIDLPFTYMVVEGESVTLSAVAFGPIRIALSMIEGELTGYLLPKDQTLALMQRMRPCGY